MEFSAKVDPSTGKFIFATRNMEVLYNNMMQFYGRTGTYFRFNLTEMEKTTNEAQQKLLKRMCIMVAKETGEDYQKIMRVWHDDFAPIKELGGTDIFGNKITRKLLYSEMSLDQFNKFLNDCMEQANEYANMGLEIHYDPNVGTLLTTKNR